MIPAMSSASNAQSPVKKDRKKRGGLSRLLFVVICLGLGIGMARTGVQLGGPGAILVAWLGVLLGIQLHVLLSLAASRWAGMGLVSMSVGTGRWLGSKRVAGRLLVFRPLPIVPFVTCMVLVRPQDGRGRKLRLWTTVAGILGVEAAVAVLLAHSAVPALGYGVGLLLIMTLVLRPGRVLSVFWTLFRLPFGDQEQRLEERSYAPAALEATRELLAGRIGAAREALGPPDGTQRWLGASCSLALAEGRFAEAAEQANELYERSAEPLNKAWALSVYAAAMADGVAAGHWQPHEALPQFARTMQEIRDTQPLLVRATDLGAVESLLKQSPAQAAKQAARAAGMAPDAVSRARALCTRAVALAYLGETAKAREVLAKADTTAPGLDRVAVVGRLLDRTTVVTSS